MTKITLASSPLSTAKNTINSSTTSTRDHKVDDRPSASSRDDDDHDDDPSAARYLRRSYVARGCAEDFRVDGRSCADVRPYSVRACPDLLPFSHGAARARSPGGATEVLCSVRAEVCRPSPARPDEGLVEIEADNFLVASSGGGRSSARERSRVLSDLVAPRAVDRRALCVAPGRCCWRLSIDVAVVAEDGCVVDAASRAARRALRSARLPVARYVGEDDDATTTRGGRSSRDDDLLVVESDDPLDATPVAGADERCPLIVTVCLLARDDADGGALVAVVDARREEEERAVARVSVAVDPTGAVCGVTKLGGAALPFKVLAEVTDLAVRTAKTWFDEEENEHEDDDGYYDENDDEDLLHGTFVFR